MLFLLYIITVFFFSSLPRYFCLDLLFFFSTLPPLSTVYTVICVCVAPTCSPFFFFSRSATTLLGSSKRRAVVLRFFFFYCVLCFVSFFIDSELGQRFFVYVDTGSLISLACVPVCSSSFFFLFSLDLRLFFSFSQLRSCLDVNTHTHTHIYTCAYTKNISRSCHLVFFLLLHFTYSVSGELYTSSVTALAKFETTDL